MDYLTVEEILFIHYRILMEFQPSGPSFVVPNSAQLESAIARPQQSAFGSDAYPDDYSKAAALTESIINGHPFEDGNKRVGITAGCVFLMTNGHEMEATDAEVYEVAMKAAQGQWKFPELKDWFQTHAH